MNNKETIIAIKKNHTVYKMHLKMMNMTKYIITKIIPGMI